MYDVYTSDIKVYFANGTIPSYNIDGKVAVALRDIDIMMNIKFDSRERTASLRVGMDELKGNNLRYVDDFFYKNQFLLAEGDYYHIKAAYMLQTGEYDRNLMSAFKNYIDRLTESVEEFRNYEEPAGFSDSAMELWWAMVNGRYASCNLYDMGDNLLHAIDDPNLTEYYMTYYEDSKAQRLEAMRLLNSELKKIA